MYLTQLGINKKLAAALGVFAALTIIAGIVLYVLLGRFQSGLTDILEAARPMNAAAYEMEINALEVGISVKEYFHGSDPIWLESFDDAVRDFNRFHASYKRIEDVQKQRAMSDDVGAMFFNYVNLGRDLIRDKNNHQAQRDRIIEVFSELEKITKSTLAGLDEMPASAMDDHKIGLMLLFTLTQAEAAGALNLISRMGSGPVGAGEIFEEEIAKINALLREYSEKLPEENRPAWLDEMTAKFSGATVLSKNLAASRMLISEDLLKFTEYGKQLNDIFDDQIQQNTERHLQTLYGELTDAIRVSNRLLAGSIPVLILVMAGLLIFISRSVIRPVRQLSEAAGIFSGGDFTHRVNIKKNDELGRLALAFNVMAERLQTAYKNLSETNAVLDAKVIERTSELAAANEQLNSELLHRIQIEQELRHAAEAANAASHAKTLFLGNMSHELRTPLNAIIGFSDIIKAQLFGPVKNEKYLDYAKDINQSGVHLLRLISELLDIARIEADELKLNDDVFDLKECIVTCLHIMEEQAMAKRIFLSRDIDPGLPFFHGDQTRIKQILFNVIGNAIKFTPAGGSVRVKAAHLDDGALEITVTDTGIGIASSELTKVLEPFGQAANDLARAHEGAGLGLPLAKRFCEHHDGALEISSAPGQGTTVTIRFPASRKAARLASGLRSGI